MTEGFVNNDKLLRLRYCRWAGNAIAGQKVDLGEFGVPENENFITMFFSPYTDDDLRLSYYSNHIYAYSPEYTGMFSYDVLMITQKV